MKIGIIIAMEKEFTRIAALLTNSTKTTLNGFNYVNGFINADKELILQQCGIGKVNAVIGAVELIDRFKPDVIISTGVAGGASTALDVMDVVVSEKVAYHDAYYGPNNAYGQVQGLPLYYESPKILTDCAISLDTELHIHKGLTVSGDWFVDDTDKMRSILAKFPDALAVDMESTSIAQTCYLYKIPFVSFRIISDIPLKENNFAQYNNFWDQVADDSFEVTRKYILAIPTKIK